MPKKYQFASSSPRVPPSYLPPPPPRRVPLFSPSLPPPCFPASPSVPAAARPAPVPTSPPPPATTTTTTPSGTTTTTSTTTTSHALSPPPAPSSPPRNSPHPFHPQHFPLPENPYLPSFRRSLSSKQSASNQSSTCSYWPTEFRYCLTLENPSGISISSSSFGALSFGAS